MLKPVKIFTFSTFFIIILITFFSLFSNSHAAKVNRRAHIVCKIDETAYWDGSRAYCCNGTAYEVSEYRWACCQEPNPKIIKDFFGNTYCCPIESDYAANSGSQYQDRGCCLDGRMEMTVVDPQPESSYDPSLITSSMCCYPDEQTFSATAASYLGRYSGCCPPDMAVMDWKGVYMGSYYRGTKCCTPGATLGACCQPGDNPQPTVTLRGDTELCCPMGATAAGGRCCNSDEEASAYTTYKEYNGSWIEDTINNDACCKKGQVYTYDGCCDAANAISKEFWDLGHHKKALRCG